MEEQKKTEAVVAEEETTATVAVAKKKPFANIKQDYKQLDKKHKTNMFVTLALILVILFGYFAMCLVMVTSEKNEAIDKYTKDSDMSEIYDKYSKTQTNRHNLLENTTDVNYCKVEVGAKVNSISNISAKNGSYNASINVWFVFEKMKFEDMFYNTYVKTLILEEDEVLQAKDYYPASTTKEMFSIGNGSVMVGGRSIIESGKEFERDGRIFVFQEQRLSVSIGKSYDSVRYPLESAQFKIYIKPTMGSEYIRFVPDLSKTEIVDDNEVAQDVWTSGLQTYFSISNGFRPIEETSTISAFNLRVNYYEEVNHDPSIHFSRNIKTQIEIAVRANRSGIGLFLQAFVNLFAVTFWMLIAFYNTSYNKVHTVDMFGTGLFGAISSILVGLQLVSDSAIFSLITMINIFTLGVILLMTFLTIRTKQIYQKDCEMSKSAQSLKLKGVMFAILLMTILMFAVVPMCSYIFIL